MSILILKCVQIVSSFSKNYEPYGITMTGSTILVSDTIGPPGLIGVFVVTWGLKLLLSLILLFEPGGPSTTTAPPFSLLAVLLGPLLGTVFGATFTTLFWLTSWLVFWLVFGAAFGASFWTAFGTGKLSIGRLLSFSGSSG